MLASSQDNTNESLGYDMPGEDLRDFEKRTIQLIINGYNTSDISKEELIGIEAASHRLKILRDKHGANTNMQLMVFLIKRGLIDIGEIKGYHKIRS